MSTSKQNPSPILNNTYAEQTASLSRGFFASHIAELKVRMLKVAALFLILLLVCFGYAADILNIISLPLAQQIPISSSANKMIYTALNEGFFTHMRIALYSAIFITFPFMIWQFYRFIAPALYRAEKRAFRLCCLLSPLLLYSGFLFLYFMVMPPLWNFLLSFQSESVVLNAKISEYLSLVLKLGLAFGLCFQLPVLVLGLVSLNIISVAQLIKYRKYVVVLMFIIAAFLTPPDVISQVLLAFPLLILYEISIILSKTFVAKKK